MFRTISIYCMMLLGAVHSFAQSLPNSPIQSNPFIQNYSPEEYNGISQNWDVLQGDDGLIYVANSNAVLEFDGVAWRRIELYEASYVRALAKNKAGRIYVGGHGDLGYLEPDEKGRLLFKSLLKLVPDSLRDFNTILKVVIIENQVFFGTDKYLYRWEEASDSGEGRMSVLEKGQDATLCYGINGQFYVRRYGRGLMRLEGDSLRLVPGGEFFSKRRIHMMIPWAGEGGFSEEAILLAVPLQGLFVYDQGKVSQMTLAPEDQTFLESNGVINGIRLKNGQLALACLQGGIVLMNPDGKITQTITRTSGLRDYIVINLAEDRQGGLWVCLNDGMAYVELSSPLSYYGEFHGLDMDLAAITSYKGDIYLGGLKGLLKLELAERGIDPFQISNVDERVTQVYDILPIDDELILASNIGVYIQKDDQITMFDSTNAVALLQSSFHPELLIVGLADGIQILRKFPKGWQYMGNINGITTDYRSLLEIAPNELWAANEQGFVRIQVNLDSLMAVDLAHVTAQTQGYLPAKITRISNPTEGKSSYTSVFQVDSTIIFNTENGKYRFEPSTGNVIADSSFDLKYPTGFDAHYWLYQDVEGDVWAESFIGNDKYIDWFRKSSDGSIESIRAPFFHLNAIETVHKFYSSPDDPSSVWLAGDNGLVRFDKNKYNEALPAFPPVIRRVSTLTDTLLFDGSFSASTQKIELPYQENSIRFEFAFPAYDEPGSNQFSFRLEGFDENWSRWSDKTFKEYTYLREGTYRFRVRAKDVYRQESESEAFTLVILAPWYRTWWAYMLYVALFAGTVYALIKWRTRRLQEQNRQLEQTVKERTAEVIQVKEQMFMQEKMASLGQMTAGIAHEIKNPLNFVNNFAKGSRELAEDISEEMGPFWEKIPEDDASYIKEMLEDIRQNADSIRKNGLRADSIINSMMNHAEHTSGQRMPVKLNQLIEDNLSFAHTGVQGEEQVLEVDIQTQLVADLPEIEGIPQELGRVLLNILQNSLYALHEKSKQMGESFKPVLAVQSSFNEQEVEIRIRDNGTGIAQESIKQIFTPFFTTKPTGKGNTGLGLSISYDIIVQSHKGKLSVDSKEGEFTEFLIQLPRSL